jgi:hypothetical protein
LNTIQFEGLKVALKQDQTGYLLTLRLHPDEIPEDLLRHFVGARYQVVMVRIGHDETAMPEDKPVQRSALLCKEPKFWEYLWGDGKIMDQTEEDATAWLRDYLGVTSRSELKTNPEAKQLFQNLEREYQSWKKI